MGDEDQIRTQIATEHNTAMLARLEAKIEKRWLEEDKRYHLQEARLEKIEGDINLYKVSIRTMKAVGLTVVAVLAFKFGDIKGLWK